MAKKEETKHIISKWAKGDPNSPGAKIQQVVYKTVAGKNRKGKTIYSSQTRHERIS